MLALLQLLPGGAGAEEDSGLTDDEEDTSDEDEEGEEHKLIMVVRSDLGMRKGKIAAQCGHATLAACVTPE